MLFKLILNILLSYQADNNGEKDKDRLTESLKRLNWDKKSVSFDETDIKSTRPGFGTIITIEPNGYIKYVIKNMGNKLVAKTSDKKFHVTVFCVFLEIKDNLNQSELPVNLLTEFQGFMDESLGDSLKELNKSIGDEIDINITNQPKIFGAKFPSHLVLGAELKEHENLSAFKSKANKLGCEWINAFGDLLEKERNQKVEKSYLEGQGENKLPYQVKSTTGGYSLTIRYTAESTYHAHATIGLFAESEKYNEKIREAYSPSVISREIDPNFSEKAGDPELKKQAEELSTEEKGITLGYVKQMVKENDKYPVMAKLYSEFGDDTPLNISREARTEFTAFGSELKLNDKDLNLREILNNYDDGKEEVKRYKAKVVCIEGGILNMDRIQNFEPVSNNNPV